MAVVSLTEHLREERLRSKVIRVILEDIKLSRFHLQ